MKKFYCPYLNDVIELTDERESHIVERHPDLLPKYENQMEETLRDPDEVRRSKRFSNAQMFCRWFESVKKGKYVVVVVISEGEIKHRHWIITSYISHKLMHGDIVWKKV